MDVLAGAVDLEGKALAASLEVRLACAGRNMTHAGVASPPCAQHGADRSTWDHHSGVA